MVELMRLLGSQQEDVHRSGLSGPVSDVPIEAMYDVLRNERRRLVLQYLVAHPNRAAVIGSLATQIAAWENDLPVSAINSTLRKRTYNTLQQSHLPKLADAGLVEYDRHRGTVSLTANPRQLNIFLRALPKAGTSWTVSILISGIVLWVLLASNWVAVHILQLYQPGQVWLLTGFALFLVGMMMVHAYRTFL